MIDVNPHFRETFRLNDRSRKAKTGLSALALKRQLGVSYPTAWLVYHKPIQTMAERDIQYTLGGHVQVDDAYLGGELAGDKTGRGSENKVPFVAAVSLDAEGRPLYVKMAPVPGFTRKAISDWARADLSAGCVKYCAGEYHSVPMQQQN